MRLSVNKSLSLVLMTIALVYLIMAFRLPEYTFVPVDADLIPKLLGFVLLILSICFFFSKDVDTEEQKKKRVIKRKEAGMLLGVMTLILIYITVLEVVGFVIMTIAFIIVCSRFLGYKKWVVNILTACIFSVGAYSLFNYGLAIRLPAGILPF
ncbi:tripartite tricarboxylate transporter TctB family protein [Halalkalibacter nanhaiisediminis]|uniref:Putative tricarboxylic transport membrane protein n=1 Tax=Halalkalibacter nanhaiisediminis TaxID=688079 RepID=A0A562QRE0_9BACI|nr:tripartite tricarboxylate transporter TctB family protein [Halalkalibacter nanhaiisediminis]TWI59322.1 putative tricarboxylic transport membrane protein [Halalkalibacter nanhaiisediminis]